MEKIYLEYKENIYLERDKYIFKNIFKFLYSKNRFKKIIIDNTFNKF